METRPSFRAGRGNRQTRSRPRLRRVGSIRRCDGHRGRNARAHGSAELANLPVALFTGSLSILPSSVMTRRSAFTRFRNDLDEFSARERHGILAANFIQRRKLRYSGRNTCLYRQHANSMSRRSAELLLRQRAALRRVRKLERYSCGLSAVQPSRKSIPLGWPHAPVIRNPAEARSVLSHALRLEPFQSEESRSLGQSVTFKNPRDEFFRAIFRLLRSKFIAGGIARLRFPKMDGNRPRIER